MPGEIALGFESRTVFIFRLVYKPSYSVRTQPSGLDRPEWWAGSRYRRIRASHKLIFLFTLAYNDNFAGGAF